MEFTVVHFNSADRPTKELKSFKTADEAEAKTRYREWCEMGGEPGSAIFYSDNLLFGGSLNKHVF